VVTLAEKLERLKGGRSYAEIAALADATAENIRKVVREGSQPGFALGVRLARVFGVPADWLGDDSADWPPPESVEKQIARLLRAANLDEGSGAELSKEERRFVTLSRAMPVDMRQRFMDKMLSYAEGIVETEQLRSARTAEHEKKTPG